MLIDEGWGRQKLLYYVGSGLRVESDFSLGSGKRVEVVFSA